MDVEEKEEITETAVGETPSKKRRWKGWLLAIAVVAAIVGLAVAAFPFVLPLISFPEINIDLTESMKDTPPGLFPDKSLSVRYTVARRDGGGYTVSARGRVLGWPFSATADVDLDFRWLGVAVRGNANARLDGSNFGISATFSASLPGGWSADLEMPETKLADDDPFLAAILSRHEKAEVRKAVFDGLVSLTAHASQDKINGGIPRWEAKARIKDLDASMDAGGKPVRMENFRVGIGVSGLAEHVDMAPMFVHVDSIEGAGFTLSKAFASIRATETAFLVTEAGAGVCGGNIHLYAFFLDMKKLNAGVTIYMDDIDAGEMLSHINGFKGTATGRLNGKLPISLKDGKELHLSKGYLHSVPGETANLKLYDPTPITDSLAMSGIPPETTGSLGAALADLDYSALRIGLAPEENDSMALTVKLEGSTKRGETTVPVSFTVTFHGPLEELINTGLRVATRKEQKAQ